MAVHVTRCPHCQTSFRVRDEHLNAARGMVRCGSCLQVFKAAEHFTDSAPAKTPVSTPARTPVNTAAKATARPAAAVKPVKSKPDTQDDDDTGLIHDDMDDDPLPEKLADDPFVDFNLRAPEKRSRPAPRMDIEFDEAILGLRNANNNTLDFVDGDDEPRHSSDDESWAEALLNDTPPPPKKTMIGKGAHAISEDEFNFDLPPPEEDDFRGFADDDEDDQSKDNTSFTLGGDDGLAKQTLEIAIPAASIARLQEEPLQFRQPATAVRRRPWGWIAGSVLMLILAAAQTLYFQFDQWARTPQWRPAYTQLCQLIGCSLPKVQNIRDMNTQHLVVRAHPTLQKALMVDTLLLNRADHEQPFPDLLLVFSDLNDRVVASRRFSPAQYLSGELAGQQDMPVRTPVHIALEIVDPGPEAVSYAISLVGNQ